MTGKAKDTYYMLESEHQMDVDGGRQEILDKVQDYARRHKLDHSATRATKTGIDPMDIGGVLGG